MKYFKYSEFDQKDGKLPGSGEKYMSSEFLNKLDKLRELMGQPMRVTSGYRSPEYNAKVSNTGRTGPHTTGKAADIACSNGQMRHKLVKLACELGFTGIGISKSFVHLDTLEGPHRPNIWTY